MADGSIPLMHKGSGRGTEARSSMYSTQIGTCCRCHGNAEQVMDFFRKGQKTIFCSYLDNPLQAYRGASQMYLLKPDHCDSVDTSQ